MLSSAAPSDRQEGGLVDELRSLVHANFLQFTCSFKSRLCNAAAHALAALSYACVEGEEVISNSIPNSIPSDVHVIVVAECSADK